MHTTGEKTLKRHNVQSMYLVIFGNRSWNSLPLALIYWSVVIKSSKIQINNCAPLQTSGVRIYYPNFRGMYIVNILLCLFFRSFFIIFHSYEGGGYDDLKLQYTYLRPPPPTPAKILNNIFHVFNLRYKFMFVTIISCTIGRYFWSCIYYHFLPTCNSIYIQCQG